LNNLTLIPKSLSFQDDSQKISFVAFIPFIVNAHEFKIIKETNDYILRRLMAGFKFGEVNLIDCARC
jgi:hypothetical protein